MMTCLPGLRVRTSTYLPAWASWICGTKGSDGVRIRPGRDAHDDAVAVPVRPAGISAQSLVDTERKLYFGRIAPPVENAGGRRTA